MKNAHFHSHEKFEKKLSTRNSFVIQGNTGKKPLILMKNDSKLGHRPCEALTPPLDSLNEDKKHQNGKIVLIEFPQEARSPLPSK